MPTTLRGSAGAINRVALLGLWQIGSSTAKPDIGTETSRPGRRKGGPQDCARA